MTYEANQRKRSINMNRNDIKRILTHEFLSLEDIKKMTEWLSKNERVEIGITSKVYHFNSSFIVCNKNTSCDFNGVTKHNLIGIMIDHAFRDWEKWYDKFVYDVMFINGHLMLTIWPYTIRAISEKALIPKKFNIKNNRLIIDDYIEDFWGFI